MDPSLAKKGVSPGIAARIMPVAIDFDGEFQGRAVIVEKIRPDRVLASKRYPHLLATQHKPHLVFRLRFRLAKGTGAASVFRRARELVHHAASAARAEGFPAEIGVLGGGGRVVRARVLGGLGRFGGRRIGAVHQPADPGAGGAGGGDFEIRH